MKILEQMNIFCNFQVIFNANFMLLKWNLCFAANRIIIHFQLQCTQNVDGKRTRVAQTKGWINGNFMASFNLNFDKRFGNFRKLRRLDVAQTCTRRDISELFINLNTWQYFVENVYFQFVWISAVANAIAENMIFKKKKWKWIFCKIKSVLYCHPIQFNLLWKIVLIPNRMNGVVQTTRVTLLTDGFVRVEKWYSWNCRWIGDYFCVNTKKLPFAIRRPKDEHTKDTRQIDNHFQFFWEFPIFCQLRESLKYCWLFIRNYYWVVSKVCN